MPASAAEVLRAVRMERRWPDPLVVVEVRRWLALFGRVARPAELAAVPAGNGLQLADRSVQDQLAQPFEVRESVTLGAVLRGQLGFLLEIIRADRAHFFHGDAQRLLAIDVHAAIHRPVGDEGVVVIRGADDHGLDVF